jgi:phosphatidylglycerophosphate synthase
MADDSSTPPVLPPFRTLLKSRDVEDPVNLWLHRPLAYAFVALVYRTRITPNMITALALVVGIAAGVCFFFGTPQLMIVGGLLLWSSAILDGADGILARAKRMQSDLGRAIDGFADGMVALATVPLAFYHLWVLHHSLLEVALMPFAIGITLFHVYLYDYYKEAYLQHVNPAWNGNPERLADIKARIARVRAQGGPWYARIASESYLGIVENQIRVVNFTNPAAARHHLTFPVNAESVRIYREYNRGPMQIWALVSLAPHSYLISLCAIFDRLDIYLWFRVFGANALFLIALVWQRVATRRTVAALAAENLLPLPFASTQPANAR